MFAGKPGPRSPTSGCKDSDTGDTVSKPTGFVGVFRSCGMARDGGGRAESILVQPELVCVAREPTAAVRGAVAASSSKSAAQFGSACIGFAANGGGAMPRRVLAALVDVEVAFLPVAGGCVTKGFVDCRVVVVVGAAVPNGLAAVD